MAPPDTQPTEEELESLSAACQKIWALDDNRLTPDEDYDINVGVRPGTAGLSGGDGGPGCRSTAPAWRGQQRPRASSLALASQHCGSCSTRGPACTLVARGEVADGNDDRPPLPCPCLCSAARPCTPWAMGHRKSCSPACTRCGRPAEGRVWWQEAKFGGGEAMHPSRTSRDAVPLAVGATQCRV